MDGIILLVLLGIGICSVFIVPCCAAEGNRRGTLISLCVLITSWFLLIYPIVKFQGMEYKRPEKPYVTHEIMALADGTSISGRIYLRRGYINEVHQYTYGYKNYNGGMKIQQANADQTTVFFTDTIDPCAKWYKEEIRFWYCSNVRYTCDIYLPVDTLVADYSIDLQ